MAKSRVLLAFCVAGAALAAASSLCLEAQAQSDPDRFSASKQYQPASRGFWEKDGARNIFGSAPKSQASPNVEYFAPIKALPKEEEADSGEDSTARLMKAAEEETTKVAVKAPEAPVNPREKIVNEFGNPDEEAPVKAVDQAPKPFKAMMAALEAGDDKLAFDYARQYVRYTHRVQQRTMRVVGMTGLAMEKEGLIEEGKWPSSPAYQKDRKDLLEPSQKQAAATTDLSQKSLDSQALALLRDKKKEIMAGAHARETDKSIPPEATTQNPQIRAVGNSSEFALTAPSAAEQRRRLRAELRGQVPVDPTGKVGAYFFFKPNDTRSQQMAAQLQQLYSQNQETHDFEVIGVMVDALGAGDEFQFRKKTGATFSFSEDQRLQKVFEVKQAPTLVLLTQTTGKFFKIEGAKSSIFVDEAIRAMQGRK